MESRWNVIGKQTGDLLPHSRVMAITETVQIKVLHLEEIIAMRQELGGEKDAAVLPILRQTARELKKRGN